jgi:DNA recombination protein Rad52
MNWDTATVELQKPLDASTVKSRSQSGRSLSYVEGWHVINEANRIFGFDGWTRETIDLKCVNEKPREIGAAKKPGFGVSYIAKVKVTVSGVVREGIGSGHGIDVDLGLAHESAAKEAETDAMKRALITFGNPFGLALYDKTKANVSDEPDVDFDKIADDLISLVNLCASTKELQDLKATERFTTDQNSLPEAQFKKLAEVYKAKKAALAPKAA